MGYGAVFRDEKGNLINTNSGIIQIKVSQSTTKTTVTAVIPNDDTIPQNSEGTEVLTCTITPKSTSNRLRIKATLCVYGTAGDYPYTAALFQDSTANALASAVYHGSAAGAAFAQVVSVVHDMAVASTASTTFKIRIGITSGGGSTGLNRDTNNNSRGGTETSHIEVIEYVS